MNTVTRPPQRLDVEYLVIWESDWHVGSGQGSVAADRLILKRHMGTRNNRVPYVPGSQLKGVLRHHCERLTATLGAPVVTPHLIAGQPASELLEHFVPLPQSRLLIDRLFGSRFQGDCLFVHDAVASDNAEGSITFRSRTSIDRISGTARHQTLFITEVADQATAVLRGHIRARHPAGALTQDGDGFPYEYALLLCGLLSIDTLGGDKSIGRGRCRVEIPLTHVRWNEEDYPLDEALAGLGDIEWMEMLELLREEASK